MARPLGVDTVVLALEAPRVRGDPADLAVRFLDVPAELLEDRLGDAPGLVERHPVRLRHGLGGASDGHEAQHQRERSQHPIHAIPPLFIGALSDLHATHT